MGRKGKKICLLLDNCTAHPHDVNLRNIRLIFLPANTTSIIQPLDQGTIRNFKALYRSQLMRHILNDLDNGNIYSFWISLSWIYWPNTISNEDLLNRTGMVTLEKTIAARRWAWCGHVCRMPPDSITRVALTWQPTGKRNRGRPKEMWRRTIQRDLKERGLTLDTDRIQLQIGPDGNPSCRLKNHWVQKRIEFSLSTLKRRQREFAWVGRDNSTDITDEDLDRTVVGLNRLLPNHGENYLWGLLKSQERSSPFGAVVAISERPNFSSEYPRHVRDFPEFLECVNRTQSITWRPKCDFTHSKNSGKSRTCRGYSELKFGRSEMATTAPKGDDRSEKRRRPFGKATTVYETEICVGPMVDAVQKMFDFYKDLGIDMSKDSSVPRSRPTITTRTSWGWSEIPTHGDDVAWRHRPGQQAYCGGGGGDPV
ncbi:hypothetical protein Bbelb_048280 [Branchiostoma belcheri]|nr:hypothetical protein Bbelb_048280 [Branchiostoma belcheri]